MPGEIQDDFGFALYQAQLGLKSEKTKVLKGFGSAGVLEVVTSGRGSTYRAVYTVRFEDAVYVLHCFQKKSKQGISTPRVSYGVDTEPLEGCGNTSDERPKMIEVEESSGNVYRGSWPT